MIYDMMYGMCMFACSNVWHEHIRCQHNHDHIYYRSIQKHRCIPLEKYSGTAWQWKLYLSLIMLISVCFSYYVYRDLLFHVLMLCMFTIKLRYIKSDQETGKAPSNQNPFHEGSRPPVRSIFFTGPGPVQLMIICTSLTMSFWSSCFSQEHLHIVLVSTFHTRPMFSDLWFGHTSFQPPPGPGSTSGHWSFDVVQSGFVWLCYWFLGDQMFLWLSQSHDMPSPFSYGKFRTGLEIDSHHSL